MVLKEARTAEREDKTSTRQDYAIKGREDSRTRGQTRTGQYDTIKEHEDSRTGGQNEDRAGQNETIIKDTRTVECKDNTRTGQNDTIIKDTRTAECEDNTRTGQKDARTTRGHRPEREGYNIVKNFCLSVCLSVCSGMPPPLSLSQLVSLHPDGEAAAAGVGGEGGAEGIGYRGFYLTV